MGETDSYSGSSEAAWAKQTQETLPTSDERFRIVVESSPNAVVLVAANGTIILLNRQAEVMFGYRREELAGQSVDVLVPQRFRGHHLTYRAEFMADPQQRPMGMGRDLFAVRKDGSELPVEIGLTPIEMPEGLVVMATITDITERKRREEELRTTAAELARSNEELGQFAHVISHDLQEPLRVIGQHLQIIRGHLGEALDDDARESMGFVIEASARMQALVRDLLAYARVGQQERGFVPTDMNSVVRLVLGDLAANIQETGASIQCETLPIVQADDLLMSQLMQNLLSNAIKFRAKGKTPVIQIDAKHERGEWVILVQDNGIGIKPEHAQRIFGMFHRLHSRLEFPGTGIGLATCKKIVERHGGRIWVESQPGQGSIFYFTIPDRP